MTERSCGVVAMVLGVFCFLRKEMSVSYLSRIPLKPATLPGPAIASHCTIDKLPSSHGMRRSIPSRFDIVGHMSNAKIGVLLAFGGRCTDPVSDARKSVSKYDASFLVRST